MSLVEARMFYRTEDGHGLPHNPFKAIITPRPIGWISTVDKDGRANLAPYSFFNGISDEPPMVMFASHASKEQRDELKDSVANIRDTGEFVVNIVSEALKDAMNISSGIYKRGDDEFIRAGLEKETARVVNTPIVKQAPAALECTLWKEITLPGGNIVVMGEVKGVHLNDAFVKDGVFDISRFKPLARLGYRDYSVVEEVFSLNRPYQD